MTIFLTISALVNIGLGYWLATYLAREKARSGADMPPLDVPVDATTESHAEYGQPIPSAPLVEAPLATLAAPMMPQPMAAVAPAMPMPPAAAALPQMSVALEAPVAPVTAAAAEAPELETEVLAGIEEFRNQLAQMKATPDAAEPAATLI